MMGRISPKSWRTRQFSKIRPHMEW
jgi:hypothetical protein